MSARDREDVDVSRAGGMSKDLFAPDRQALPVAVALEVDNALQIVRGHMLRIIARDASRPGLARAEIIVRLVRPGPRFKVAVTTEEDGRG